MGRLESVSGTVQLTVAVVPLIFGVGFGVFP